MRVRVRTHMRTHKHTHTAAALAHKHTTMPQVTLILGAKAVKENAFGNALNSLPLIPPDKSSLTVGVEVYLPIFSLGLS